MKQLNIQDCIVLIIDVQDRLLNSVFNKETCGKKAKIIASAAKILGIPVIATEQYPKGLGNTLADVSEVFAETTKVFEKNTFSALENSEVSEAIKSSGKKQILIFGIETHICVSQTASALVDAGYEVSLIKDACGSRAEEEFNAGIDRMKENGVSILTTEIALFELLKGAKHPNFKEVQGLIK